MNSETIYQIILLVLANEASEEECRILSKWIEASEENKAEYIRLKRLYQISSPAHKEKKVNTDQAWQRVCKQTILKKRKLNFSLWLRYAAMVAIIISAGIFYLAKNIQSPIISEVDIDDFDQPTLLLDNGKKIALNKESFSMQQKQVVIKNDATNKLSYESNNEAESTSTKSNHLIIPKGKTYQLLLSDGTRIWLNSETELIYPTQFTGDKREITLIGEAFFAVAKNKDKPFIVRTNGMNVEVLGTSFNVCSYTKDKTISTTLVEGSVSVQTEIGSQQTITPSEQFTYDKENNQTSVRTVDTALYTSWINGEYHFKDATLDEIINKLQRWYTFSINYQDESLKENRYSLTVSRNTSLEQLLEIISYTSDVKLERTENNTINIKKQRRGE